MPRNADMPCADCGKLMWRGPGSLPEGQARCRNCRSEKAPPAIQHGTPSGRDAHRRRQEPPCDECRLAWNQVCRQRQQANRDDGYRRPGRRQEARHCADCGIKLPTGGRAALDPRCTACYSKIRGKRRRARTKRRTLELKLRRAATGTSGTRVWVSGECAECLTTFTRLGRPSRFCSSKCRRKARKSWKIALRDRLAIYDRDGWTCQLCLEPVDRDLMSTDPLNDWAPSLDHIEPRSAALIPDHSARNLRLAHRWCNSVRGDLTYYTDEDLRVA